MNKENTIVYAPSGISQRTPTFRVCMAFFFLLIAAPSCSSDDDGGSDDATTSSDTGMPPAQDEVLCEASTGGCRCSEFADDELTECSATSVGDFGHCCESSSSCQCVETACVKWVNGDVCECGPFEIVQVWGDVKLESCPILPAEITCCLDVDIPSSPSCKCSADACGVGETQVTNCDVADVAVCSTSLGEVATSSCL